MGTCVLIEESPAKTCVVSCIPVVMVEGEVTTVACKCMGAVTAANSTRLPPSTSSRDTDSDVNRFNTCTA
jgi:hypothetical protein